MDVADLASEVNPTAGSAVPDAAVPAVGAPEPVDPVERDVDAAPASTPGTGAPGDSGGGLVVAHPVKTGFAVATGALLAIGLGALMLRLSDVLAVIATAMIVAIAMRHVLGRLTAAGWSPGWARTAVVAGMVLFVFGFFVLVLPPVVGELSDLVRRLPGMLQQARTSTFVRDRSRDYPGLNNLFDQATSWLRDPTKLLDGIGGVFGVGRFLITGIGAAVTVIVLAVYLTTVLDQTGSSLYRLMPASRRDRARHIGALMERRVGAYIVSHALVAALNATVTYLFLVWVGVPYAMALAVMNGVLGLIPLVGTTIGATVVVLVAFTQSLVLAVVTVIFYVLYQQLENLVIAPRIYRRGAEIPAAAAILAGLGGATLYGMVGVLIAIPATAAAMVVLEEVVLPAQDTR